MGQVISFSGYTPAARFDDVAWSEARIEEGDTSTGPWTQIDVVALTPADVDPSEPQSRSFSTENGSLTPLLWYRVIFAAADGSVSQASSPVENGVPAPTTTDLCSLSDVTSYVPAYVSDEVTDAKLQALITAESLLIASESGREIIGPIGTETRTFDISETMVRRRVFPIGDLDALYDELVTILNPDGSSAMTVQADDIVPLYEGMRQPTRSWEPITQLFLPLNVSGAPVLIPNWHVLEVTARWGFPEVPAFIREACAKRVILRYLSDVARDGTNFAAAVGESDLNLAAMFQSAADAIEEITTGAVVIA